MKKHDFVHVQDRVAAGTAQVAGVRRGVAALVALALLTLPLLAAGQDGASAPDSEATPSGAETDPGAAEAVAAPVVEDDSVPRGTVPAKETSCTNRLDDDGDAVVDCGDADCAADPACQPDGNPETDDNRCSDWVDNDADGYTDCDDVDCQQDWVKVCKGSWTGPLEGGTAQDYEGTDDELPPLGAGGSVEDLIGNFGDADGERNDVLCADGIDNDGDGMTDCADFGCRFDPQVTICRGTPGLRFSVVGQIAGEYVYREETARDQLTGETTTTVTEDQPDTSFKALQMRVMGPIPLIQDSFFLLSMRGEKTPRLTFAMFQVPIGGGHYLNINSGGGGLSSALIRSRSKQLLVEPPYYLYNAFEQGNGAAAEVGGPILPWLDYRVFAAGGSGRFAGNVGGRYFTYNNDNYTWGAGAQLDIDLIGHLNRWDTPMLYTPVPMALGAAVGAKYDQRAQERYPAANVQLTFRYRYVVAMVEAYLKDELEFGSTQVAYNAQVGVLVWPKNLLLAADFGQFRANEMENPPDVAETDIRRQQDETMWRVALHWFYWRNIGVLSAVYQDQTLAETDFRPEVHEQRGTVVAQFRF